MADKLTPEQMLDQLNAAEQAAKQKNGAATLPPSASKKPSAPAGAPAVEELPADLLARLEAAEAALAATKAENERLRREVENAEDSSTRRAVRPAEQAYIGDGYLFEVRVRSTEKAALLGASARKEVRCCDESEALRWYCATTADPKTGKQLDPVLFPLEAKCLEEPRRKASQLLARQKSVVREKLEKGMQLTDDEERLFMEIVNTGV